jgi:hypothetical protein
VIYIANEDGSVSTVIEKAFDELSAEDIKKHWDLCEAAIRKELQSFVDCKTFVPVKASIASNIMSSRWVLRWKLIDGVRMVKAR